MTSHVLHTKTAAPTRQYTSQLGFWIAIFIAGVTALSFGLGITTPPRSGAFCLEEPCILYPYTDAAAFVPRDYLWMYPALLIGPLFIVLIACIGHTAAADKQLFGQIAEVFAGIAAAALAVDYFIQLAVVQPSLLKGEIEGLSLFSQYNPHGIFIALEDIGYLMMSVALLFAGAAFGQHGRLERAIRLLFIISGVLGIGSLIVLALQYGSNLEYRYEVMAILINWVTLIVAGGLLSVFFRRNAPGSHITGRPQERRHNL